MELSEILEDDNTLDVFLETFHQNISRRTSIYNTSLDTHGNTSLLFDNGELNYENKLQREIKEWDTIWRATLQQLKTAKCSLPTLDINILPKEKLDYLKAAPNLKLYMQRSIELREMHALLYKECTRISTVEKECQKLCGFHIGDSKLNTLDELLANAD